MMTRHGRSFVALLASALVASVSACSSTGVHASDVEQGCTEDAECVVVEELEQVDARCTVPCQKASIHRSVTDRYNRLLARERGDCVTVTRLVCDPQEFVATCQLGRCVAVTPAATPAGDAQARQEQQQATPEYRSPFAQRDDVER